MEEWECDKSLYNQIQRGHHRKGEHGEALAQKVGMFEGHQRYP